MAKYSAKLIKGKMKRAENTRITWFLSAHSPSHRCQHRTGCKCERFALLLMLPYRPWIGMPIAISHHSARFSPAAKASTPKRPLTSFRLIRQLHLWIGAWGAVPAILFGITAFVQ